MSRLDTLLAEMTTDNAIGAAAIERRKEVEVRQRVEERLDVRIAAAEHDVERCVRRMAIRRGIDGGDLTVTVSVLAAGRPMEAQPRVTVSAFCNGDRVDATWTSQKGDIGAWLDKVATAWTMIGAGK